MVLMVYKQHPLNVRYFIMSIYFRVIFISLTLKVFYRVFHSTYCSSLVRETVYLRGGV